MRSRIGARLLLLLVTLSVMVVEGAHPSPGPNAVHVTLLHLNDCYELMPASGTDLGGVARVATLAKRLRQANPNTFTFLAGDLFAPSALSTTPIPNPGGTTLDGNQMVVAMNAIGVDAACLGNHETDLKLAPFTKNMNLSNFTWLSTNAMIFGYQHLQKSMIFETKPIVGDSSNRTVKLGVMGMTVDSNNRTGVETYYGFEYASTILAPEEIAHLNDQGADIIVALTHYDYEVDQQLVERAAGIHIVVGGHDHNVIEINNESTGKASIYKADSNVRTVWVHDIWIDTSLNRTDPGYFIHHPQLITINSTLPDDPATASLIQPYIDSAFASFAVSGFNATNIVCRLTEDLDMRGSAMSEGDINRPIIAGRVFAESIYQSAVEQMRKAHPNATVPMPDPDLAIFNVGSLRLDDVVTKQTILLEYDILRITPFLNRVQVVNMTGRLLHRLFETALNQTRGLPGAIYSQYLVYSNVTLRIDNATSPATRTWLIAGQPLVESRTYLLAACDYLLTAPAPYIFLSVTKSPTEMSYFYQSDPTDPFSDPRIFFIRQLNTAYPPNGGGGGTPTDADPMYIRFDLRLAIDSLAELELEQDFLNSVVNAIAVALQIRSTRVTMIQAAPSVANNRITTVFLRIGANVQPDPITATEASDKFLQEIENESSTLRSNKYLQSYINGTAASSTSSTPPKAGDSGASTITASLTLTVIIGVITMAMNKKWI